MSQPTPIIADPISSDGSEESWILLDEMDEAMREDECNGDAHRHDTKSDENTITSSEPVAIVSVSSSSDIEIVEKDENDGGDSNEASHSPVTVTAEEALLVDYPSISNVETMSSCEAISTCPSNAADDDDEVNDAEHLRRYLRNWIRYFL